MLDCRPFWIQMENGKARVEVRTPEKKDEETKISIKKRTWLLMRTWKEFNIR